MNYDNFPITDKKLGITYTTEKTVFRVWSPLQNRIEVLIYSNSNDFWRESHAMTKLEDGVHELTLYGDLKGKYYTFLLHGREEVADPYAIASSVNSIRSAIVDLKETNPEGWNEHKVLNEESNLQPIIYEVHVKDFSVHESSGAEYPGKYLGFAQRDTKFGEYSTGINHLEELGITHVHLMPVYDFLTVKEEKEYFYRQDNYNWGYDPELYNVPEGSYSIEPENPISRIKELKTLIMELHKSGIKVVLDVVYNHTYRSIGSNFERLMPGYYHRRQEDGSLSNGSACGNELATEKPMVRKFILDSLTYWVQEYKVDGFRFDLMALLDINTVEEIVKSLRKIKPDILIYGEPWTADITVLPHKLKTTKGTQNEMKFAFFNDDFRDAIKGDNDGHGRGFVQGNLDYKIPTETGIAGSIYYDDAHIGFTSSPRETINYVNSHDNLILTDKMKKSCPDADEETLERLNKLTYGILFTSQGMPLIHGGNEFLRSKYMVENSYNSPLEINAIDWSLKERNRDFFNYFKELIHVRKRYRAFNLEDENEIKERLKFMEYSANCKMIIYTIMMKDHENSLLVMHNASAHPCILPNQSIRQHIEEKYKIETKDFQLIPVFDVNGLVENGQVLSEHCLKVPFYSTKIFEIRRLTA